MIVAGEGWERIVERAIERRAGNFLAPRGGVRVVSGVTRVGIAKSFVADSLPP